MPDLIKFGSTDKAAIQDIKTKLNASGKYGKIDVTNPVFDFGTLEIVKQFQKDNGLKPDGIVGPLTQAKLNAPKSWAVPADKPVKASTDNTRVAKELHPEMATSNDQTAIGKILADGLRKATPFVPNNVGNWARKKMGISTAMNNNSIKKMDKAALYKMVDNAIKRTGKLSGTTEYEDYETTPNAKKKIIEIKKGNLNPLIGAYLGTVDPAYNMATTVGRGSYTKDPVTGNIKYTDNYDFKNNFTQDSTTGKLKAGYMKNRDDFYGIERRKLAEEANTESQSKRPPAPNKIRFDLSPKDTIGYQKFLDSRGDIAGLSSNKSAARSLYDRYHKKSK